MENLIQDLKHGVRLLARRPGFAVVAIASLALGVGLNTTLFSVVNAVLLRNTPVQSPERLVEIYSSLSEEIPYMTSSYPDYLSIRDEANAFSGVTAHAFVRGILSTGGKPVLTTGETITPNYFDVLGIRPALGRGFRADENVAEGQHPVVVLSHGLWQRRFGGRPEVLGEAIELSGVKYTVVGVAPVGFAGMLPGIESEFWVPVMMVDRLSFQGMQGDSDRDPGKTRIERRGQRWLFVKGRLAESRTVAQAQSQVETIFARLRQEYPITNEKTGARLLPGAGVRFHPMLDGYVKAASAVLLAAVALVLTIACANVANMLLARGASRRRELAVRAAIGRLLVARGTNLGYDPAPVSYIDFNLQMNGYDLERAMALRKRVLSELRARPGVAGAALVTRLPLAPDINMEGIRIRGHHQPQDDARLIDSVSVGSDYFQVVGVPIVEGRPITDDDVDGSRRVVVINQAMARRFWPGRSPLGELIYTEGFAEAPHEVVGVARDHKVRSVGEDPRAYLHFPARPSRMVSLAVRTTIPAEKALPMLRSAILALEPDIVFTEDIPATEVAATTTAPTRIGAALLGAFGALALLLAAVGLYGVIAYSVTMRTREMGVRMALGARPADVVRLVLRQGGRLAVVGIGAGALLAALVGRVLGSLLYGVSALDPLAYAIAATILLAVAALASFVPALTAARVDPLRALRSE